MEKFHRRSILNNARRYKITEINEKDVILLTEDEVPDPIAGDMAEYVDVFEFLRPHIAKHLDSLARTLNISKKMVTQIDSKEATHRRLN